MSTEGRLASLDTNVSNLNDRLASQNDQLGVLDGKIDELLLREATRIGEAKGTRKASVAIAAIVSSIISAVALAAPYFVNG